MCRTCVYWTHKCVQLTLNYTNWHTNIHNTMENEIREENCLHCMIFFFFGYFTLFVHCHQIANVFRMNISILLLLHRQNIHLKHILFIEHIIFNRIYFYLSLSFTSIHRLLSNANKTIYDLNRANKIFPTIKWRWKRRQNIHKNKSKIPNDREHIHNWTTEKKKKSQINFYKNTFWSNHVL